MAELPVAPQADIARASRGSTEPIVIVGGLLTTALALAGVWFASQHGVNVMGWYANYVIPVGALVVGLAASSGYGIGSYLTGTKVTGRLLFTVLALLTASYFLAKYVEFRLLFPEGALREDGTSVGFWEYFDIAARSIYFKADKAGQADGSPLGLWGYGVRALEMVGFVGGGVLIPVSMRKMPYCARCQAYMKTKSVAFFAAGIPLKKISKKKVQELQDYEQANLAAFNEADAAMKAMLAAAAKADGATLAQLAAKHPKLGNAAAQKLTLRTGVYLVHCPRCHDGLVKASQFTGAGNAVRRTEVAQQPMDRAGVVEFLSRAGKA